MAFSVILLGGQKSLLACFRKHFDDLPLSLVEMPVLAESSSVAESIARISPRMVVHLGVGEEGVVSDCVDTLMDYCAAKEIPFILLSSFLALTPSVSSSAIMEDSDINLLPGSEYERLELSVRALPKHILLRTSWVLDGEKGLLSRFIPPLLSGEDTFHVSDHHLGCPLSQKCLINFVLAIVMQVHTGAENWGVFHLHSADTCSEAEFCDHLVRQLQKEFDRDFILPAVSGPGDDRRFLEGDAHLAGRRCTENFGIQMPTWRRGFTRLLASWLIEQGYTQPS